MKVWWGARVALTGSDLCSAQLWWQSGNLGFSFTQEKCAEGAVTRLAVPTPCRFTMFPSLKQRPTLVLEQDTLSSFSLSLSVFSFLFVALLVSLNKPQRFLGNGLSEKKSYHGIFLAHSISPPAQDMGFPWPPRAPYKAYSCVCGGACTCVPAWARWACCANLS